MIKFKTEMWSGEIDERYWTVRIAPDRKRPDQPQTLEVYPNSSIVAAAPEMAELLKKAADELHSIGCGKDPADGLELSEHIAAFLMDLDGEEDAK